MARRSIYDMRDIMYQTNTGNDEPTAPVEEPSQNQTQNQTQNTAANRPNYNYAQQSGALLQQIMGQPGFKFDLNGNALWNQYKDQYTKLGQQAMTDTMGRAAGLTGGYGSSYAQNVGQQAYNDYLTKLNDIVPNLYSQELSAYKSQLDNLYNQYSLLSNERANDQNYAMQLLQMGVMPSDALLSSAGISKSEAQGIAKYYGNNLGGSGTAGGTGNGGAKVSMPHVSAYVGGPKDEEETAGYTVGGSYSGSYGGKTSDYTGGKQNENETPTTFGKGLDQATYNGLVQTVKVLLNQPNGMERVSDILTQYKPYLSEEQYNWINQLG